MPKPKHAPRYTCDCLTCCTTFNGVHDPPTARCDDCGGRLYVRRQGAEPYQPESYADLPAATRAQLTAEGDQDD